MISANSAPSTGTPPATASGASGGAASGTSADTATPAAANPDGPRVLVVGALDISLLRFRGRMIEALIARGYRVWAAAPAIHPARRAAFEAMGAVPVEIPLARTGLDPRADLATFRALLALVRRERIDLVLPYTLKPVIYGSFAARRGGAKALSLITGLGYTFAASSAKARAIRALVTRLYRAALRRNVAVLFQNADDRALFGELGILPQEMDTAVVSGSGVDLAEFAWREPSGRAAPRFVFAARLIEEKGISLYLAAAERLKGRFPEAEFLVLGDPQPGSPSAIDMREIERLADTGTITYFPRREDIVAVLSEADVFVLPSWYREGVPRSLLEALSIGMALITTDMPGCRETVRDGENGFLVPPRDGAALERAIEALLEEPGRVASMSRASRALAEGRFDVRLVNADILERVEHHLPPVAGVDALTLAGSAS